MLSYTCEQPISDAKYCRTQSSQSDAHPANESVAVLSWPDITKASSHVVGS